MNPLLKLFQMLSKGEKNSAEAKNHCEYAPLQPEINICSNEKAAMPDPVTVPSEKAETNTAITVQQEEEKTEASAAEENEADPLKDIRFETPSILMPSQFTPEPQEIPSVQLSSGEAVRAGYSFRKRSKSVKITGFHGKVPEKLIIPCCIDSIPVEEICSGVFSEAVLKEVYIPGSVRKMGIGVFKRSTVTKVFLVTDFLRYPGILSANAVNLNRLYCRRHFVILENVLFAAALSCVILHFRKRSAR